jgi:hypothetical protein
MAYAKGKGKGVKVMGLKTVPSKRASKAEKRKGSKGKKSY